MADVRGTFFSAGEPYVTAAYVHKAQDLVAREAEKRVHILQHVYFKKPTGYYERHIVNRDMGSQHLIHDSDVVYGPWLEGVGSRNFPTTRFKGYSIMRKVTRSMQDRGVVLADRVIHDLSVVLDG